MINSAVVPSTVSQFEKVPIVPPGRNTVSSAEIMRRLQHDLPSFSTPIHAFIGVIQLLL